MNKKGMEMSINAIVAIVLAIMMFGAGIFLFQKIVEGGQETLQQADQAWLEKVKDLADNGQAYYIYPKSIDVKDKDQYIAYVGVKNIFNEKKDINVTPGPLEYEEGQCHDCSSTLGFPEKTFDAHESQSTAIVIDTKDLPLGDSTLKVSIQWFNESTTNSIKDQNALIYIHK